MWGKPAAKKGLGCRLFKGLGAGDEVYSMAEYQQYYGDQWHDKWNVSSSELPARVQAVSRNRILGRAAPRSHLSFPARSVLPMWPLRCWFEHRRP